MAFAKVKSGSHLADIDNSSRYIPNLDGLRALSIITVLMSHFISNKIPGGLGVYVFFVISGFLIARQFFNEWTTTNQINVKNFYMRRVFRLYPVVIFYAILVIAVYKILDLEIDWIQPISSLFYFSNYLYAEMLTDPNHKELMPFLIFWSLSVEEHFYLIFPAAFIFLKGRSKNIFLFFFSIIIFALTLRVVVALANPDLLSTRYFYYRTEFRMDSIAFGVLIAALCSVPSGQRFLKIVANPLSFTLSMAAIFLCLLYRDDFFRETYRYSVLGVSISLALVSVLFSSKLKHIQFVLNTRSLIYVGKISYSLYVWHLLTPYVAHWFFGEGHTPIAIAFEFIMSFAIAASSYHFLEVPFIRLRKRLH